MRLAEDMIESFDALILSKMLESRALRKFSKYSENTKATKFYDSFSHYVHDILYNEGSQGSEGHF